MSGSLSILLAQIPARIGDIAANADSITHIAKNHTHADLIVFPELHLCGYPPEDLVLKPSFVAACREALERLAQDHAESPALLVGLPWADNGKIYNAVALLEGGKIAALRFKHHLPNYGVFDEKRIFASGDLPEPIAFKGHQIGVPICEDIWQDGTVTAHLKQRGAEMLIVPNGSPFTSAKHAERQKTVFARVQETGLPLAYLNRVGGQDELVFDGASFGLNADLKPAYQASAFERETIEITWNNGAFAGKSAGLPDEIESLYRACCLGLRDYVHANGFKNVLLGLSGGIDSALVAAMCADALGAAHVRAVMLPSQYTSQASMEDAKSCAKNLTVRYDVMPITQSYDAALDSLSLIENPSGLARENLQSRLRGTLLMALSNTTGAMLMTTGNKSEMAVGYATLYGDMNGGFNPLKDLYKMQVYALARWRNREREIIPARILTKAPSAELRANQTDQDSLPVYDILDAILKRMIEQDRSVSEIVAEGYERAIVEKVAHLLRISEFKRRQSPPGPKLTSRNFGRDRRYPISNGYKG